MAGPASEADPAGDVAQFRKWEYRERKVGEAETPGRPCLDQGLSPSAGTPFLTARPARWVL